jgi:hypothetical protein
MRLSNFDIAIMFLLLKLRPIARWGGNKMADACILGPIAAIKMAMEVDKELNWKDVRLSLLEHYRPTDTSSTVLGPGYKFIIFGRTGLRQLATKWEFSMRVLASQRRYVFKFFNRAPF